MLIILMVCWVSLMLKLDMLIWWVRFSVLVLVSVVMYLCILMLLFGVG